eukprot:CAMPEP_0201516190 /NCGR_PEP_ID=MMETSP0161_2-20130828/7571_1 /ASSEMBLY_ACC=CAM_ASM_000251 /TAXON_ID=180227 /ORGANISM="Neoparamoeba aestuarina, Strain SoJaBio B1-5/56/2" /LENGTH=178 /DNA_ID=CAMNT_0047913227 /DNA_START=595 /DNA_END=1132 /DNA_ORIENTATION=+
MRDVVSIEEGRVIKDIFPTLEEVPFAFNSSLPTIKEGAAPIANERSKAQKNKKRKKEKENLKTQKLIAVVIVDLDEVVVVGDYAAGCQKGAVVIVVGSYHFAGRRKRRGKKREPPLVDCHFGGSQSESCDRVDSHGAVGAKNEDSFHGTCVCKEVAWLLSFHHDILCKSHHFFQALLA